MGLMIFIMASGLTIVFGLMDVINFGHGAFVSLGAFLGVTILLAACWLDIEPIHSAQSVGVGSGDQRCHGWYGDFRLGF